MLLINAIYNKIKPLRIPKVRKKIIMYMSFLVLILIVINFALFYISEKNSYIQQMKISNENLAEQIGFSYETVIKNVKNSVHKTALSDMELIRLVQNYDGSFDYTNDIFDKLYDIILTNDYIDSAYIYIPKIKQVFSTANNVEKISYFDTFSDKIAFDMIENKNNYNLGPRTIEYNNTKKQVYSIVSSVPLNSEQKTAFLAVNIDLNRLRYDILLKFKSNDNMYFYVVDDENSIVITEKDSSKLGTIAEREPYSRVSYNGFFGTILRDNITITSVYNSDFLKWNFVLQNSIDISSSAGYAGALIWFATISILLLIISLMIIPIFTRPINRIIVNYNDKLWKDFITDSVNLTDEIKEQLLSGKFENQDGKFGAIVLYIEKNWTSDNMLSYYNTLSSIIDNHVEKSGARANIITSGKNTLAVIICYADIQSLKFCSEQHAKLAQTIYDGIDPAYRDKIYLGVSTIKEHFSTIPALYRECMEVLKYKLTSSSHLLYYSAIKDKEEFYEYPVHLEKQLLNNLSIGDFEACRLILDEFFLLFIKSGIKIKDDKIIDSIYNLINSVLKNITNTTTAMHEASNINIANMHSLDEIKAYISGIIEKICVKISEKNDDEKSKSYRDILDYIDKNYTSTDISVNKIADELGLNRGFVSKVINETTGKSFTDYINGKRIALSKILLRDKSKTIKDIAEEVGYNYSYYFIRIFKNIEGITPGQYRNNMDTADI